jgi:hypothetical protein
MHNSILVALNNLISIRVGYDWGSNEPNSKAQKRWSFIRDLISDAIVELNKRQHKLKKAPLNVRLARMRAIHGGEVLGTFIKRCKDSDILVFDISTENPNVMLELGLAIAAKKSCPCIYVFHEQKGGEFEVKDIPSDLRGYFITSYRKADSKSGDTYKLVDQRGFKSSLMARISEVARDKGLMVDKPGLDEEEVD